ncbi:MAG: Gfo/Idh/MocA family oxidoreductase [Anaerolineae bacterium]|nr:Gfo/Idh/MocA family oxidoreductase [Anaerolineae bacterium]
MTDRIRWGILGTGNIAHQFARGLAALDDVELLAVGSRAQESADRFGDEFAVPRCYASYEALANDADVDVIYVSTPHPFHRNNALLCLRAGKATLVEKPFAINTREAGEMIAAARSGGVFLMEAMWTRFTPVMGKIRELLAAGTIGEVRMLNADFGFRTTVNPTHRLFDLALGGGALLDVGVYPISLASMIFGEPVAIKSLGHLGETGADEQNAVLLGYTGGQIAMLSSATRTASPHEALIMGTDGMIRIAAPWWKPEHFTLTRSGASAEVFDLPFTGNGYNYEAAEAGRCLRAGELESAVMPLEETRSIMQTMDAIRAQWNLVYPMEQA